MKAKIALIFLMFPLVCSAQIQTREVATYIPTETYDSLSNVPLMGLSKIIGQEILVLSAEGFFSHSNATDYSLSYSQVGNKYYSIKDCHILVPGERALLKFQGKEKGDTIYLAISSTNIDRIPFLVVGYYEKMKQKYLGKKLALSNGWGDFIEINTGRKIEYKDGDLFTCNEVVLASNNQPSFILGNDKNEAIAVAFPEFTRNSGEHDIKDFSFR